MFSFLTKAPQYHSKFGGLWIDRLDADKEHARRLAKGRLSSDLGWKVQRFAADGYIIFPKVVDPNLAEHLAAGMTSAFSYGNSRLVYQTDGADVHEMTAGTTMRGTRIIEAHALLPAIRDVFSAPDLVAFLTAIFDEPPVLSQTLMFQMGSEQPFHRDTTFVRFDSPLRMVGCWVALEDVRAGSGELGYIVGSHRLPDFPFSTGKKDGIGAGASELAQSLQWLVSESEHRGFRKEVFNAKKGDVLIWHADLAHGGQPITDPRLTRRSLVGHLSPQSVGRSAHPGSGIQRKHGPIYYSSTYYDVRTTG